MKSIDLVICLGGDGTVLHTSSLFSKGPVPPIVGFSLGTLGFLLPFRKFYYFIKSLVQNNGNRYK